MDSSSSKGKKAIHGGLAILNAASTGNLRVLKRLVKKFGDGKATSLKKVKDRKGRCALHFAASNGKTHVCEYLIDQLKFDVDIQDEEGNTPLTLAIIEGHHATSSLLLNQGAQPIVANKTGMTALHFAAEKGNVELMQLLILNGAEVEVYCSAVGTPLNCASCSGVKGAVKLLLDNHANPNSEFHLSPLMAAVLVNSVDSVRLLLKAGADPNRESLGETPLITAATRGRTELIDCLLDAGADPNATDFYGLTAIEIAAREGNVASVIELFEVTTCIPRISDWSCEGIINFVNSYEAKKQYELKAEERFLKAKENGDQAFRSKEYSLAIFWYRRALDSKPLDAAVLTNRSLCWEELDERKLALEDAIACVMPRNESAKVYQQAGVAFSILGNYKEALRAFKMGMMLDPKNDDIKGACRDAMKKYERELKIEIARLRAVVGDGVGDGISSCAYESVQK